MEEEGLVLPCPAHSQSPGVVGLYRASEVLDYCGSQDFLAVL